MNDQRFKTFSNERMHRMKKLSNKKMILYSINPWFVVELPRKVWRPSLILHKCHIALVIFSFDLSNVYENKVAG